MRKRIQPTPVCKQRNRGWRLIGTQVLVARCASRCVWIAAETDTGTGRHTAGSRTMCWLPPGARAHLVSHTPVTGVPKCIRPRLQPTWYLRRRGFYRIAGGWGLNSRALEKVIKRFHMIWITFSLHPVWFEPSIHVCPWWKWSESHFLDLNTNTFRR